MSTTPASPPSAFGPPVPPPATEGPYRPAPAVLVAKERAPRRPLRTRELAGLGLAMLLIELGWLGRQGLDTGGAGLALVFATLPLVLVATARPKRRSPRLGALLVGAFVVAGRCLVAPNWVAVLAGLALSFGVAVALRAPSTTGAPWARSLGQSLLALPRRMSALLALRRRFTGRVPALRFGPSLALPLVLSLAFVGVFALANPFVGEALLELAELFGHLELPGVGRVLGWALALVVGLVLVRPSVIRAGRRPQAPVEDAPPARRELARNTMVALNGVFAAYLVLEAATVAHGAPPEGMTTQVFAHRGAFWLTVALAMLTLVVSLLFRGPLARDPRALGARRLALLWAAQGLVLAGLTYGRIALHVRASGLSDLRIFAILGTTLVVVGVVLVIAKVHGERPVGWLLDRQTDAFAFALVLYAVLPTHRLAAEANVARLLAGDDAPLARVWDQAAQPESAGVLLPLMDHDDPIVREGVAALLLGTRDRLRRELERATSWRDNDLLRGPVLAELEAASPQLSLALGDTPPWDARRALGVRSLEWQAPGSPSSP
ncbi:MAG: DUF4153 domain-containing protein [Myxococcota bacterium]